MLTHQNHIIPNDQTMIITLLKQIAQLLENQHNSTPLPSKPKPTKPLTLKQFVHQDFQKSFYKKWNL